MKASVSITTYNHERFIAQAIESVLMQETDFDYKIIIGEDDSSDGTREIVKAYKAKFPEKIKLFLNDRKNVIYVNGKPTGIWNLSNNLKSAQGQYVALLDGDDYWTSPYKLQKQVDFLDEHSECAICFHGVQALYQDGRQKPISPNHPEISTLEDILKGNFIAKSSVMFRNGLFGDFPDWYYTMPMGDWPLHILNAQHGDIGYINQVMAVYRIHSGSIRSLKDIEYKLQTNAATLETLRPHLDSQHVRALDDNIARWHLKIVRALLRKKDYRGARSHVSDLLSRQHISKKSLAKATFWILGRDLKAIKRRVRLTEEQSVNF
jgi:glycosyltransferase involved in cell wall biosynthesis